MKTIVPNMLRCAQDLVLKSFVAMRYTARQIQVEASSNSQVIELEEKIAALESEKLELQKPTMIRMLNLLLLILKPIPLLILRIDTLKS